MTEAERPESRALVVRDASKLWNVPPHFVLVFESADGTPRPYVTKDGMLWKLREFGFRSVETSVLPDPEIAGGWIAEARITPNLAKADYELLQALVGKVDTATFFDVFQKLLTPTIAHATANEGNVRMATIRPFIRELAETRALMRAARIFTGMGLSTPEEE